MNSQVSVLNDLLIVSLLEICAVITTWRLIAK
jgi:hypothetical protein